MTESNKLELDQINRGIVSEWVNRFSKEGKVGDIDLQLLRETLASCGAKIDSLFLSEAVREGLAKYTNEGRGDAMREVWGENYRGYKKWTKEMVDWYETEKVIELPALKTSGLKTSGMIGYLGDLTAFATGEWTKERYTEVSEARWEAGRIWRYERGKERPKIILPNGTPHAPSSYQPDFPSLALKKVLTWQK